MRTKWERLELLHFGARFQEKDRRQKMTRSASHFCFVVFPPQSLLDVLESRVMKRTLISYCAVWDFAISAMANSTTQNDSQCESFFIYSVNYISQIIHTVNDFWAVWEVIWEAKLHSAKFWACDGKVKQTFAILFYIKIFYHYNVYIIMIFLNFI